MEAVFGRRGKMNPGEIESFEFRLIIFDGGNEDEYRIPELPPAEATKPLQALVKMLEEATSDANAQFFSNTVYSAGSVSFRNQAEPAPAKDVVEALKRFVAELEGEEQ
jgi:hypothetical protein